MPRGLAHPEQAGDGPDPGQQHGHAGEPLHDERQGVVHLREVDLEGARREVAQGVELLAQPDEMVVDIPVVEDGASEFFDAATWLKSAILAISAAVKGYESSQQHETRCIYGTIRFDGCRCRNFISMILTNTI